MKRLLAILVVTWLCMTPDLGAASRYRIRIPVGRTVTVPIGRKDTVVLGDSSRVRASLIGGGRKLLLSGLAPGATNLEISSPDGRQRSLLIRVLQGDPETTAADLEAMLVDYPEIRIQSVGEKVIVRGTAATQEIFKMIEQITAGYPEVINLVRKPKVSLQTMVELELVIINITHSRDTDLGLGWPGGLVLQGALAGAQSLAAGNWQGTISLTSNLALGLRMLSESGDARMLAHPTLVAISGSTARFQSGGELPVPVAAGLGQTQVSWKSYGLQIELQPTVDTVGNIDLKLVIESSRLDYGNAVATDQGSIPALQRRKSEAQVNLAPGEGLLLADLYTTDDGSSRSQVPLLGSMPIIGELFRQRARHRRRERALIAILPKLIRPGSLNHKAVTAVTGLYEQAASSTAPHLLGDWP